VKTNPRSLFAFCSILYLIGVALSIAYLFDDWKGLLYSAVIVFVIAVIINLYAYSKLKAKVQT